MGIIIVTSAWTFIFTRWFLKKNLRQLKQTLTKQDLEVQKSIYTEKVRNLFGVFGLLFLFNIISWAPFFFVGFISLVAGMENLPPGIFSFVFIFYMASYITNPLVQAYFRKDLLDCVKSWGKACLRCGKISGRQREEEARSADLQGYETPRANGDTEVFSLAGEESCDDKMESNVESREESGEGREEFHEGRKKCCKEREESHKGREESGDEREESRKGREESGDEREESRKGREESGDEREESHKGREESGDEREESHKGREESGDEREKSHKESGVRRKSHAGRGQECPVPGNTSEESTGDHVTKPEDHVTNHENHVDQHEDIAIRVHATTAPEAHVIHIEDHNIIN